MIHKYNDITYRMKLNLHNFLVIILMMCSEDFVMFFVMIFSVESTCILFIELS